jgi:glyoxylase-like metal-dependent hydrolase (beta-lactamase superfamily II)
MWSTFDQSRDVDFNSIAWIRDGGNVLIDPLPMSEGDLLQLEALGGAAVIVITNSDHVRDSAVLARRFAAQIAGPAAERDGFAVACKRWLADGDEVVPGLRVIEMHGSKTPGELALVLEGSTLITGDLVRGQRGGALNLLPDSKLADLDAALQSVRRLAELRDVDAVLVGDGWPVFRGGGPLLAALLR